MIKKIITGVSLILLVNISLHAQDEFDALRYGYTSYMGTARSMAIGNAMGSLGGDFTSLSVNPAGIGIYRRGELLFSPSFSVSNNQGTYLGNNTSTGSTALNISNFGLVLSSTKKGAAYKKSAWKSGSFAFGMNRNETFKNEYTYSGTNRKSSLIEKYAEEFNALGGINAVNTVSYPAYAAYQTWLIDRGAGADSNLAVAYVPFTDGIRQTKRVYETGGMQEYVISAGGNYQDKMMLGATVGIPRVTYNRTLQFDEEDISGKNNNDFKYMYFTEKLSTTGTGINLKLGAIFKPDNNFRFGIAFHTPTYIQFNDISAIEMESHTDSLLLHNGSNPVSIYNQDTSLSFNYAQSTPYKALVSGTAFFKQYGFITADLEYVDYSSMKYNYGQGYENESQAINTVLKNTYKGAINFRGGAEVKMKDFAVRAGVAYYGSPYRNSSYDASRLNISGGVGYRTKSWFIDAAFVRAMQTYKQMPYTLARADADVQTAEIKNSVSHVVFTFGYKFQ
ncbi:MAG: hypothetical protein IT257_09380 [Chitinophagaceae bacterium]|nr:hypothetical protein [Chitinophagaceae bacterium]